MLSFIMGRMVAQQRQQIGTLKALGYSNGAIGRHFAGYALWVVGAGFAMGVALGAVLGQLLLQTFLHLFRLPVAQFQLDGPSLVASGLSSLAFGLGGVAMAVVKAVKLKPAEAMKPEPPSTFRSTFLDRWNWIRQWPSLARMVIRQAIRRRTSTLLSAFGIAAAIAILVTGGYFFDGFGRILTVQFDQARREDLTVLFSKPLSREAVLEVQRLPGVLEAEAFQKVPAQITVGPHRRLITLQGWPSQPDLVRSLDAEGHCHPAPLEGVQISRRLAQEMGIQRGQSLTLTPTTGHRRTLTLRVSDTVEDMVGLTCAMAMTEIRRHWPELGGVTGVRLRVDPASRESILAQLRARPQVVALGEKRTERAAFIQTSGQLVVQFAIVLCLLGLALAGSVVYNSARAAFADRAHELAVLRILGRTQREVAAVAVGENLVHLLLALPWGCLFGAGIIHLLATALEQDALRLPPVVSGTTLAGACLGVIVTSILVAAWVACRVGRLNLVDALRTRE